MGKASAKKVSRAARTGGGRTRRGSSSFMFPAALAIVAVLGTVLIVTSRNGRAPDQTLPRPPEKGRPYDHWHAAIGFDLCGTFAPPIQSNEDPLGIHTHGDGVVHIHPFLPRSAGKNAVLKVFLDTVGAKVTADEVRIPGQKTMKHGTECDGRPGKVQVRMWPNRSPDTKPVTVTGDPGAIKLLNDQLITVAFVPDGTDIPKPPSEGALDRLTDVGAQSTIPGAGDTVPPSPDSSVPGGTDTTAPGATTASTSPTATTTGTPATTAP